MLHDHVEEQMKPAPVLATRQTTASEPDEARWDAVQRRDTRYDGAFVYGVTSTGVFCRPGCPSRRPRRDRVRFFDSPEAASRAGFRPCRRCRPTHGRAQTLADAIVAASRYLAEHADESVPLETLARLTHLSPSHLQRRFKEALGVSPREYQAACRAERFRRELRSGRDVTAAMYEAGYGSPSRVYEAKPTGPGMPPATYRRGGEGVTITFTCVRSSLGWLLVAATPIGVCAVKLGDSRAALEAGLRHEFPHAAIAVAQSVARQWMAAIVAAVERPGVNLDLPLDVRGTAFQWRVWRALQQIPAGETRSYSEIARAIGQPAAVRAVARACATNPVCLVVPCHRVIGKDGALGGYRWGTARKAKLLRREAGRLRHQS